MSWRQVYPATGSGRFKLPNDDVAGPQTTRPVGAGLALPSFHSTTGLRGQASPAPTSRSPKGSFVARYAALTKWCGSMTNFLAAPRSKSL